MTTRILEPPVVGNLASYEEAAESIVRTQMPAGGVILSVCETLEWLPDPLAFLAAGSTQIGNGLLWQQPHDDMSLAGAGIAAEIVVHGPDRIAAANAAVRHLRQRVVSLGAAARFPLVGGFAFGNEPATSQAWRHFPGGRLIVPQFMLQIERGVTHLRISQTLLDGTNADRALAEMEQLRQRALRWLTAPTEATEGMAQATSISIPNTDAWQASVSAALEAIDRHTIDKVVLAREERITTREPISVIAALRRMQSRNAQATRFAMQSGTSWFLGATPERLVRLAGDCVDVTCLAGSIAIGDTLQQQAQLAHELLASAKDREEHEIVVRAACEALNQVCLDVRRDPDSPLVVAARSVQHLESRVTATMPASGNVLDLVARLHPTPAVGGHPQQTALKVMHELESIDRGWYAGPFGWLDLNGSGEFAVAIRSAVVDGNAASLFAGCGIVAGSHPRDELAETELKLQPMRAALGIN